MTTDAWVLQALVDAKDEAVFALDRDLRYLAFNRVHADGMRALYGAEIELGGRLTDYQTVEEDREGAVHNLELALAGERVVASAHAGGESHRRFYDLAHIPLVKDGEVVGIVVHTHDVTERTRAERALRDNERALSTLLDNVPDVVFHVDREYRLVTANAAFSKAVAAAGGSPMLPGDPIPPPESPEESKFLWRAHYDRALDGEPFVVETTVPMDDGTHTMENHLRPVLDGDGATTGVVVTSRDITERRRTEDVRAFLARTASRTGDEPFFEALARYLATSLHMHFVCIDRLDPDGLTAHTLAVWTDGRFEDNVSYALKDTPCGDVVGQAVCCFPEGVQRSFPDDEVLRELCAESYVGVTLFSHTGRPIGLIAVIGREPLVDRRPAETLLELVAVRAASELERLDAEEQLRQSEEDFRTLAESVPQIVWMTDADGKNTYFNRQWVDYTGMTLEESYGDGWNTPFHPDDRQRAWDTWQRATQDIAPYSLECRLRRADGAYRWWLVRGAPLRDADGTIVKWFGTCTDIEEIKQNERELQQSRALLQAAMDRSQAGIAIADAPDGKLRYVNEAGLFIRGGSEAEVVDQVDAARYVESWHILHHDGTPYAPDEVPLARAVLYGETSEAEFIIRRDDQEDRVVLARAAPIHDAEGAVTAGVVVFHDVTERKQAESEVRRLNENLEQRVAERTRDLSAANTELEEFVYSIAHDLRSPLRSLSGFSQIVEHDYAAVIDETGKDYLRRIRDAAGHLDDLMDALLSLSQIGRRELDLHDVDLSALARGVAEALRDTDPERQVDFEIEEGLVAKGDAALCEIVMQNLLGNAWKFSAGETPALIRFGAESRDGRRVFCVSDNGVGFDPEYAGKLFAPFERLHTADQFPGTGIGLATVRRAVTRLGGRCWADAEPGGGARLYFTLTEPA